MKNKQFFRHPIFLHFIIFSTILLSLSFVLKKEKEKEILLQTNYGEMRIKLYNETPLHRDNIIKLVQEKYYDSLIFHRVINGFMIQCGDPNSKGASSKQQLGFGGPNYTVPAEFNPMCIHKKGALAAARLDDRQNPLKASSGSQFYIVQGRIYTDAELDQIENQRLNKMYENLINQYFQKPENAAVKEEFIAIQKEGNSEKLNAKVAEIKLILKDEIAEIEKFKYTPEQRTIYKTIGGTPNLDFDYTVFGEVIEGIEVVDKIAAVQTNKNDRPRIDIIMKVTVVK